MALEQALHLAAGVAASAFGGGVLLGDPHRSRNRAFGLLCGALALWNLGYAAYLQFAELPELRMLYLAGSFATAPLGLYFAMALGEFDHRSRSRVLAISSIPAAAVWLTAWSSFGESTEWRLLTIAVVASILVAALSIVARTMARLSPGPERRALALVLAGGVLAAAGGLSDFLPHDGPVTVKFGPLALLLFLLILSAVVVRHRFLDVGVFFLQAVALLAAAAASAFVFYVVVQTDAGRRYTTLLLVSLMILAIAVPLGRRLSIRAQSLIGSQDPIARALIETSRKLSAANSLKEVLASVREAEDEIPGQVSIVIYVLDSAGERYEAWTGSLAADLADLPSFRLEDPLPRWLADEGLPVTLRYLERERFDALGERAKLAERVYRQVVSLDARIVVPLHGAAGFLGWIVVAGGLPEHYISGEVATAFLAVANQATAGIERVRALEKAKRKEALAAVGELAAGLAHEIRNPVSAIRGAAQALGPEASPEQRAEMLTVIDEESARLGSFVGEFLDYARPRDPQLGPLDVAQLVRRCTERMGVAGICPKTGIEVTAERTEVLGDGEMLRQAVENLIRNACEATGPEGHLKVKIESPRAGWLNLRFIDDGHGVPPEDVGRVFQPFHTTKPSGTGLGLATVHRILQAHGGSASVAAGAGNGAEFVLSLPLRQDHGEREGA